MTPQNEFKNAFEFAVCATSHRISEDHIRQSLSDEKLMQQRFSLQNDPNANFDDFKHKAILKQVDYESRLGCMGKGYR